MIWCLKSSSSHSSCATSLRTSGPAEVLVERDRDVEHGARPVLALVADPQDLAVADVPDRALDVAEPGDPQAHRLDGAAGLAEVDRVTDAVLVLEDHEDAGQEVLDQALRAEAQRDADDAGAGEQRADGVAESAIAVSRRMREDHVEAMLLSREPIVSARCARAVVRVRGRSRRGAPGPARRTSRSIALAGTTGCRRRARTRTRIASGLAISQLAALGEPRVPGVVDDREVHCRLRRRRGGQGSGRGSSWPDDSRHVSEVTSTGRWLAKPTLGTLPL